MIGVRLRLRLRLRLRFRLRTRALAKLLSRNGISRPQSDADPFMTLGSGPSFSMQ